MAERGSCVQEGGFEFESIEWGERREEGGGRGKEERYRLVFHEA